MRARELIHTLLDEGTFRCWDGPLPDVRTSSGYATELAAARERTGLDESVTTGEGRLLGARVAVMACEFAFLGGSIGVAAGERLTAAVERATAERLPLLALPASGGTRMQEGTTAFLQMVKITAAVAAHKAAHLPYLVYLRHPTTGGVFASWGSLGHLTLAEPGALIGFLGPRVYEALHDTPFPKDVQTAENLHAHGLIDAVVPVSGLARFLGTVLSVLNARARPGSEEAPAMVDETPAWDSVLESRRPGRAGVRDLLRVAATDVVRLRGTQTVTALARFGGNPCVLVGQDRDGPAPGPGALRLARHGMRLAADLKLPLVTVIDTPGAELSQRAEEGGLASEIALCLTDLITLPAPTLSLLLGQGTGGAALALLPADRVLAAQHAWLSPLPPEGASAIVHRGTLHAPELAAAQRIRASDLRADGIVDDVVPEDPHDRDQISRAAGRALARELAHLIAADGEQRLRLRRRRYRHVGL
ncbi:carboxyl transferase domain-containing protein [Actinomadura fibrosa]|uniref:Carboxyl transferase domain-containing protein n=1 Tax=Actinomadura fibrosa TaxID=111802 RepID=A0ABW2XV58_9ACTN|nr:carboxyl transferase domain-containing protein [Actinomadura fibrosa]